MIINKTTFTIIEEIRQKVEIKNFQLIRAYLDKYNLPISKDNFDRANEYLYKWKNIFSYCSYVNFLNHYFIWESLR